MERVRLTDADGPCAAVVRERIRICLMDNGVGFETGERISP